MHELIKGVNVVVEHIFKEANKMRNFIANNVFYFAGIDSVIFPTFQILQREAKTLINVDKDQVPNLRI